MLINCQKKKRSQAWFFQSQVSLSLFGKKQTTNLFTYFLPPTEERKIKWYEPGKESCLEFTLSAVRKADNRTSSYTQLWQRTVSCLSELEQDSSCN